jgi:undecaprenyl-diphosphatase
LKELIENILYYDYIIWYHLNVLWRSPFLDWMVPFIRNQWTWAPLYVFLLAFMLINFGKRGAIWCLFFLLTFAISDQISSQILKEIFQRTRPCFDPHFSNICKLIVPCGGGYSLPSSHATNHFALALFIIHTLKDKAKWILPAALFWAIIVCYAQVYVGVHFPLDVTFGAMIGAIIGRATGGLFLRLITLDNSAKN